MSKNVFGDEVITEEQVTVEQTSSDEAIVDAVDKTVEEVPVDTPQVTDAEVDTVDEDAVEDQAISKSESIATRNFAAIRESKRELEAKLAEQAKLLQSFEKSKVEAENAQKKDDDEYLDDDDKRQNEYAKQQQNMQQMYAQTQAMQAEIRLKQKYEDFDAVVSADNVDVLKALYPKVAYHIINEKDIYAKAEKAYEAMKKYNIFTTDQGNVEQGTNAKKEKVAKNMAKPRPLSSAKSGSPALGAANAFADDSPEERRRVYAEMRRLARGE